MKKEVYQVLEKIESYGYQAYLVGGYPRDAYLKRVTEDYDICTNALPEQLKEMFSMILEENFGSLKVKEKDIIFEITTFRIESSYIGTRTPIVSYTDSLQEDLQRRDFTINTLCMDKEENYIDYLGAIGDIQRKVIKAVGNPYQKIEEDSLRILRAIRFATIFHFTIEEELEKAIIKYKTSLKNLSYYRKRQELDKIFLSENCIEGIQLLQKYQLEDELECHFDKVMKTNYLESMWAQFTYSPLYPFTKDEKKEIDKMRTLIHKDKIEDIDYFYYGKDLFLKCSPLFHQTKEFIEEKYQKLPIHSRKEIDMDIDTILSLTEDSPSMIYAKIEEEILRGKLKNTKEEIIKYILTYFNHKEIR